jgi:hypothetical protein
MGVVGGTNVFEVRIGVTGHRKLAKAAQVTQAVRAALAMIRESASKRALGRKVSWVVDSPLALGADRIVATQVMDVLGGNLEVWLPFAEGEFRKDFKAGADLKEFESLRKRARLVREQQAGVPQGRHERNEAYLNAGLRVVDRCDCLLAIWSGGRAAAVGGTGDVVRYALENGRGVVWIDANAPETGARWIAAGGVVDFERGVKWRALQACLAEVLAS